MPAERTIIVDSRENTPLPIPSYVTVHSAKGASCTYKIRVEKKALATGDYCTLSGLTGIERKGSPRELWGCCCGRDAGRFLDQLDRMADTYRNPYLLLEMSLSTLQKPGRHWPEPFKALSFLFRETAARRIAPIFISGYASRGRDAVGKLATELLISTEMESCRTISARARPTGSTSTGPVTRGPPPRRRSRQGS
jgi:hypothetical protein